MYFLRDVSVLATVCWHSQNNDSQNVAPSEEVYRHLKMSIKHILRVYSGFFTTTALQEVVQSSVFLQALCVFLMWSRLRAMINQAHYSSVLHTKGVLAHITAGNPSSCNSLSRTCLRTIYNQGEIHFHYL